MGALDIAIDRWEQAIAALGWTHLSFGTAYVLCATVAFACSSQARGEPALGRFWKLATSILVALAIETLLQPGLLAAEWLRETARADGWYTERRALQFRLLGGLILVALLTLGWTRSVLDANWKLVQLALAALGLLTALHLLRRLSFHDADLVLNLRIAGLRLERGLELAGLLAFLGGGTWFLRRY